MYAPIFSSYIAFNNHRRICLAGTNLNGSQKQSFVSVNEFQNDNFGLCHTGGSDGDDDELALQNNLLNSSSKKKSKLLHGVSSNDSSQLYSEIDVDNNNFSMDDDLNLSNHKFIDNKYISFQRELLSLTKTHEQEDIDSFDNHDDSVQNVSTNNFSSIGS